MALAAAVLPESMLVPASTTMGTLRYRPRVHLELVDTGPCRHADTFAEIGKVEHGAEYFGIERRAEVCIDRIAECRAHRRYSGPGPYRPGLSFSGRCPE